MDEALTYRARRDRVRERLDLYELDRREPCAYVDREGFVLLADGTKPTPRPLRPWRGENMRDGFEQLPQILFADIPIKVLHLSCGLTVCALVQANAQTGPVEVEGCVHDWVDARNEVVLSGEVCRKCGAIRAGNRD